MELTQSIILPVLIAAIVVNTVILLAVVVMTRVGRRDRISHTRSALEGSIMSTSFVDRPGRHGWPSNGGSLAGAVDHTSDDELAAAIESELETDPAAAADPAESAGEEALEPDLEFEPGAVVVPAGVDALTGLPGPGEFTRLVAAEDARIQRYHRPATVVIFELGGLDRLIDRLGSDAADRVVPALADTMRRLARDVDHVARLAPGRFGVLLAETDEVAAINYVERVRRACELWLESGAIALSLATGWAGTSGDPTLVEAQRLATDRMYVELRREARKVDR
jgi:diguanylate cyclase (GGDEF)-like protein